MKVLCNRATKLIEGFSRWDGFDFDPATHVVVVTLEAPDQELDRLNNTEDGIRNPTKSERGTLQASKESKQIRDEALQNLSYDFGGGRIMQTRPKDESNIRNAIEIMTANSIANIGWVMSDNIKQLVTVAELQTALQAGQLAVMQVWNDYTP